MMYKIIILLLLGCNISYGQFQDTSSIHRKSVNLYLPKIKDINFNKLATPKVVVGIGLMAVSGAAAGYKEVILHHYPKFAAIHPNVNHEYFNPDLSWTRKWKNGDPQQGPRFWQSDRLLVPFTDFYHLVGIVDHSGLFAGTVLITIGEKRKWYEYFIQLASGMLVRSATTYLVYDVIYK